jgi:hypothetical protein
MEGSLTPSRYEASALNKSANHLMMNVVNEEESRGRQLDSSARDCNQTKRRKSSDNFNYGSKLYHKGIKMKEEFERVCKEAKVNLEQKELEGITFHPVINQPSSNKSSVRH